jgi:hypothetical protein
MAAEDSVSTFPDKPAFFAVGTKPAIGPSMKATKGSNVKHTSGRGIYRETRHGRVITTGLRDFYELGEAEPCALVDFGPTYGEVWMRQAELRPASKTDVDAFAFGLPEAIETKKAEYRALDPR